MRDERNQTMRETRRTEKGGTARLPDRPATADSGPIGSEETSPTDSKLSVRDDSLQVAVLTGGGDKPYALGLASSLIARGVAFDFIGSNEVDGPELHQSPLVRFLNLRGDQEPNAGIVRKAARVLTYYARLIQYATAAKPKVFHILWNNKFELLDRTLLLLYYRALGNRIAFTAHNVNVAQRDGNDSLINRLTLKVQYRLVDHIFVHTDQMKQHLQTDFGVAVEKISVIPFGINSTVPNTALKPRDAKRLLGLAPNDKAVLFFGNIAPYKGLEYLVGAMANLTRSCPEFRLIVAGRPKNCTKYWEEIQENISRAGLRPSLIDRIEFIPDEETEIYFKAADVLVLPYTEIFQSGVLFLGYNFGLPVIASDVGSLRRDVVDGETGFIFKPRDSESLTAAIRRFFKSDLYALREERRAQIMDYARQRYSWAAVSETTRNVYALLGAVRCSAEPAASRVSAPAS
jgi:glycosyltransferase involved in cell wall biosynthesis